MSCLAGASSRMTLGARPVQGARAQQPFAVSVSRPVASRTTVVVQAKQNSLRAQRVAKRNHTYNTEYKELVKSSSRATIKGYEALLAQISSVSSEADLKPVDTLLSTAMSNIDKAVVKGVMHQNTGDRRKAKLAKSRKAVLQAAGLYPASA